MTTDILATEIKVLALRIIAQQREDELGKLLNDAADEIESLVARAALNGGMALEFKVRAEAAEAERDQLLIDFNEYRLDVEMLEDEVERLRNEKVAGVAALEAAGAGLSPASGQALAADPAPVCVWGSHLTQRRSGLYDVSWVRCDGSHVQYYADNTPCFVCGKPIKFTEAKDE